MPRGGSDVPLPAGWDLGRDYDGAVYYIDHNNHKTTWVDPRDSLTKPASFADCVGDELPVGWEQVIDYNRGVYFVNHVDKQVQSSDPRMEWRAKQEEMLRSYLTTAQEDLQNKKELAAVKEARLNLAQDEYRNLNSTLSSIHHLAASNLHTSTLHTSLHASNTSYFPPPSPTGSDLPDYCNLRQVPEYCNIQQPAHSMSTLSAISPTPSVCSESLYVNHFVRTGSMHDNQIYANSRYMGQSTHGGGLNTSKTGSNLSLNSTTSTTSTKYDPDLLKADVAHARARVQRLRRELANIHSEVEYKSKGVETLNTVNNKFEMGRGLTPEEALAIRSELQNIQQSLVTGEQEKVQLMKSLACLKEDLTRLEVTDGSMDVPPISQAETLSIASQTDLSGEEMVPVGARLAELARLRLQYDESRRNVQELQQRLSSLEERISPGQLESDNDRLLLIQEKEQLLRELRSMTSRSRNKQNNEDLRQKIRKLEKDLNQATETSNRCIADRLKTHEEKQDLLQQLKVSMRSVTTLESQLKVLSASTLSMSSSSSLGSLGSSSHASSKGSLSSLSFTDIYGMSTTTPPDPSMLDLQRRVDKILLGGAANTPTSSTTGGRVSRNQSTEELTTSDQNLSVGGRKTSSQLSLSPRSSLSSVSPPVSPYDPSLLPSYEQAYLNSQERTRRLHLTLFNSGTTLPTATSNGHLESPVDSENGSKKQILSPNCSSGLSPLKRSLGAVAGGGNLKPHRELELSDMSRLYDNNLVTGGSIISCSGSVSSSAYSSSRRTGQDSVSSDQSAPLSPISESAILSDGGSSSRLNPASRSVSAAVSDESVAGDSGVFEAACSRKEDVGLAMNLETAQIQIKLRYSTPDGLLHIGIEKARNLSVLFIPEGKKVCIKAALLPAIANVSYTFCTRALANLTKPNFGENFPVAISKPKLVTKTLQVNVWAIDTLHGKDDCLGSAQVSLADFSCTGTSLRWYNVLSFHFMQPEVRRTTTPTPTTTRPTTTTTLHAKQESEVSMSGSRVGTLKEESSDESTIISSQTSTLTRNIGPECMYHQEDVTFYPLEVEYEDENEDNLDSEDEEEIKVEAVNNFVYPTVEEKEQQQQQHQQQLQESVDKETNTDTAYIQPPIIKGRLELGGVKLAAPTSTIVKRSKTFSPTAPINKAEYSCRLNRSDSDSAMPLYRRMPFQRSSRERRSLHFPSGVTAAGARRSASAGSKSKQTSLDLELDLAAQNSRLQVLKDEIDRLKKIKEELERVKEKGDRDIPTWIGEDHLFSRLVQNLETSNREKSSEERKMEKLLRRTAKEIYKLRRTKNRSSQLDVQSFREKMAFLTNLKSSVPILGECDSEAEAEETASPLSTSFTTPTPQSMNPTPDPNNPVESSGLRSGLSTETVDTLTEDDLTSSGSTDHVSTSQNSTPTPSRQVERFVYEVDPELGAFV